MIKSKFYIALLFSANCLHLCQVSYATYKVKLIGEIDLTKSQARFSFTPSVGGSSIPKYVALQTTNILPDQFVKKLPASIASLDPLKPIPQNFNFGTVKKYIRCTFKFDPNDAHIYHWEGKDKFKSYTLNGEWQYPPQGFDQDNQRSTAELVLSTTLEKGNPYRVGVLTRYYPHEPVPNSLGTITDGPLYYNGNTVYLKQYVPQMFRDPRPDSTGTHYTYTHSHMKPYTDIPTHKGSEIVFVQPIDLIPGQGHTPQDFQREYTYRGDLSPQDRLKEIDTKKLLYSNGSKLFIPKITQELWESNGRQVGFAIASINYNHDIVINSDDAILNDVFEIPEGLYYRKSQKQNPNKGKYKQKWLRLDPFNTPQKFYIEFPTGRGFEATLTLDPNQFDELSMYLTSTKLLTRLKIGSTIVRHFTTSSDYSLLDLSNNKIDDQAAATISQILQKTTKLKILNLDNNIITKKGAEEIAKGLLQNTTLTQLNLARNQIGDEGVSIISDAIGQGKNTTLTKLVLTNGGGNGQRAVVGNIWSASGEIHYTQTSSALKLNGINQCAEIINPNNNTFARIRKGPFTIETEIKTDTQDEAFRTILRLGRVGTGVSNEDAVLALWKNGKTHYGSCNIFSQPASNDIVADNKWHHIIYTREGENQSVYIDGKLESECKLFNPDIAEGQLRVGGGLGYKIEGLMEDPYCFKGLIRNVKFYNIARSPSQIQSDYSTRIVDFHNLISYWSFDSSQGNIVPDKSRNNNDLRLINNANII